MTASTPSPRCRPAALARALTGWLLFAAAPAAVGAAPARAATPATTDAAAKVAAAADAMPPFSYYYGLYIGGQKVGFMHTRLQRAPAVSLTTCLQARVAGMGRTATVTMREERRFSAAGALQAVEFVQQSDGARVCVVGKREGARMVLHTEAGGVTQVQRVAVSERLVDDLAAAALARAHSAEGATASARHLDPSSQQEVRSELDVQAIAHTQLGGVPATTYRVRSRYPALGVEEESTFDAEGKMLAAKVGGFFEARLEDEAVARAENTVQDVLLGAVVKTPSPLPNVAAAQRLQLDFAALGPNETLPPAARHSVAATPTGLRVTLRRDAPWHETYVAPWRRRTQPVLPADVATALRPTPYLQSEAPPIRALARHAVGDAKDVGTAVARLCAAVRDRLEPAYVPAFSNALQAYNDQRGDCTEHSALFAALARAAGLPTRPVVGIAYWPAGGGFGWHAWNEVWAAGQWRQVDPTWDQPIADVTHLKLADGGPAEQASVVMLLGRLRIVGWQVPPA